MAEVAGESGDADDDAAEARRWNDDEVLDDDWDWDTEIGRLEPEWVPAPPPPPTLPPPSKPREQELRTAVLTADDVGEFLRACRAEAGLSQRELAAASGVPQPTIARIEAGRAPLVQLATVVRLTQACDVELVGSVGETAAPLETDLAQRHQDAAGRMLPAHLVNRPTTDDFGSWWGDDRYTLQKQRARPRRTRSDVRLRDLPED